jgi:hypothetical protein
MKTSAVIFTYEGDRELSAIAAAALLKAGCRVTLAWDKNAPQWALRATPDAEHVVTDFNRGRNLNGPECVHGMFDVLDYARRDADWVLKVDSDTVIRSGFFARLAASRKDAEGFYCVDTVKRAWWGACYAIRAQRITTLQNALRADTTLDPKCPEDLTVHTAMTNLGFSMNSGPLEWIGHNPKGQPTVISPGAEGAHYGDLRNIPAPHFTVLQRKKYLAKLMAADPVFSA